MLAREIMHTEVITVAPNTSLADVASLMVDHEVDGLPVVDGDGRLVGMISATDFLRLLLPNPVRFLDVNLYLGAGRLHQKLVQEISELRAVDVMTRNTRTVSIDTALDKVVGFMGERGVRHVPVLDEGRVIGIIHRLDVVRLFTDWMTGEVVSE